MAEADQPTGSGKIVTSFATFCEGDIEPTLKKKIDTLIDCGDDYIVYLDEEFYVEWSMTDEYDMPEGFGQIISKIGELEAVSENILDTDQRYSFARLLGEAAARLLGDEDEARAKENIAAAEEFLEARALENARWWYISTALAIAGFLIALGTIFWIFRDSISPMVGTGTFRVVLCGFFGGVGAAVFITSRSKDIKMDAAAGKRSHQIESAVRMVVGLCGGILMGLLAKADVVTLFNIHLSTSSPALLMLASFCAGFSERVVPNMVKRVDNSISLPGQGGHGTPKTT